MTFIFVITRCVEMSFNVVRFCASRQYLKYKKKNSSCTPYVDSLHNIFCTVKAMLKFMHSLSRVSCPILKLNNCELWASKYPIKPVILTFWEIGDINHRAESVGKFKHTNSINKLSCFNHQDIASFLRRKKNTTVIKIMNRNCLTQAK